MSGKLLKLIFYNNNQLAHKTITDTSLANLFYENITKRNVTVTSLWDCNPFLSISIAFNDNIIASVIAELL